jgi:enoyl-CoA hydratase/carnithine racemase
MQQAYRSLRIIAEAQTIRIVLAPEPDELMLNELCTACDSLRTESSSGIKGVVLDFNPTAMQLTGHASQATPDHISTIVANACAAVRAISQPVLAVVRATLSQPACMLIQVVDFTLVAEHAELMLSYEQAGKEDRLTGTQAARLGYITWSAPANDISKHMQRILDLLRAKSAVALRHAKASVRLTEADHTKRLETLQQVNTLYLTQLMQTHDAQEGLQAFLEKRKPSWRNI